MKQTITALFMILSTCCLAQEINKEIKNDFNEYYRLVSSKNLEGALNYTNPKVFEVIPREQVKSALQTVYNTPNLEYKTGVLSYIKFENVKRINNVNYVKFYINAPLEIKLTDQKMTPEKLNQMKSNLEAKFGKGRVLYDEKTGFFKINQEKIVIANADDKLKDWTFILVDNPKMKALLKEIVPAELLD